MLQLEYFYHLINQEKCNLYLLHHMYLIETINRPNGERAGSSPWDRIAKASDGVVFQFGDITKRVPESLYKRFRDNISQDKVEVWLDANLDH